MKEIGQKTWIEQIEQRQAARMKVVENFWQYANVDISVFTNNTIKGQSKMTGDVDLISQMQLAMSQGDDFGFKTSNNEFMFFIKQQFMIVFCPDAPEKNSVKEMKGKEFINMLKLAAISKYEFVSKKLLLKDNNYIFLRNNI